MLLTKASAFIIGPIASLLGYIMNAIFWVQVHIGIPNIGLCIILFTLVVYLIMTPLTVQQQRFSRLSAKMNPELQDIQKKYGDKKNDQAAMTKMNEETQAVYSKYGVNPMGSCLQLIIQMPILFALYRVIWNVPAYVTDVYHAFQPVAEELLALGSTAETYMSEMASNLSVTFKEMNLNTLIDVLYKFKPDNWADLAETFPAFSSIIATAESQIDRMNFFLGLNIAQSPMTIIQNAWQSRSYLLVFGAILVPLLSALTQWINAKLASTGNDQPKEQTYTPQASTGSTMMRSMNTIMPLMSAFFCLTLPVGMGIYWIAGAVIRSVQQVIINRSIDKMDIDALIQKNIDKQNAKRKKQGLPPERINNNARMNTRILQAPQSQKGKEEMTPEQRADKMKESTDYYKSTSTAKPGSLAAKAQMVQQYNEKNRKK